MSLIRWMHTVVRSGELNRRRPIRTINRTRFKIKVWSFLRMGTSPTSKGYLWMRSYGEALASGSDFRFEALRVMPETEAELRQWRFRGGHTAVEAMLGYSRDFNRRARRLIMRGQAPYYVHRQVSATMDQEGRAMLLSMITQLACAAAGAMGTNYGVDTSASELGLIPADLRLQSAGAP